MASCSASEPEFDLVPARDLARERAIQKVLMLFQGKKGVHARQWYDRSKDACGYVPVDEPLTADLIGRHLDGAITLGIYPLMDDNHVFLAALDVDVRKSSLRDFLEDPAARGSIFSAMKAYLLEVKAWSDARNLPVVFEYSGMKGVHAWYFFERPVPAGFAIGLLQDCVGSIRSLPEDLHVEIFPRQERQGGKGFGNLIKLPLGVHRKSGKKSVFLTERLEVVADQYAFLLSIERVSSGVIDSLYESWREAALAKKVAAIAERTSPCEGTGRLPDHIIFRKCPVLGWLAHKAEREGHLTFVERKVLLGVLGHVDGGRQLLHGIISRCGDYSPQITDHYISKLKGTPLGCNRIRRLLFYLDGVVRCDCVFEGGEHEYATPLNHMAETRAQTFKEAEQTGTDQSDITAEVRELRAELARLKQILLSMTSE